MTYVLIDSFPEMHIDDGDGKTQLVKNCEVFIDADSAVTQEEKVILPVDVFIEED